MELYLTFSNGRSRPIALSTETVLEVVEGETHVDSFCVADVVSIELLRDDGLAAPVDPAPAPETKATGDQPEPDKKPARRKTSS